MQDRIAFDERIQAAKELIDACVAEWTQDARPELLAIIDRTFSTDNAVPLTRHGQKVVKTPVCIKPGYPGGHRMQASEFNHQYPVGSYFIFQPCPALCGGRIVKTLDVARDLKSATVVEVNLEPYFANIKSLTPAG